MQRFSDDIKTAMKAGDKARLLVLRTTLAALKKEAIDAARDLSEAEEVAVLQRGIKQRRESADAFTKGQRPELAAQETLEAEILSGYLPRQLSDDELAAAVAAIVRETGATSAKDMGKVMGRLLGQFKGQVDGARAKEAVQRALGGA